MAAVLFSILLAAPPALTLLMPAEADARAGSSGGYSRPSSRTPSVGAPSSGGYRRPAIEGSGLSLPRGGGDWRMSRQSSAEALQRYRSRQDARRPSATPPRGWDSRPESAGTTPAPMGAPGFGSPGFGSPGFGSPGFGSVGNAVLMWFLLDTLSRPGRAEYFHDHADDPAYRAWRTDAESRAQGDSELRAKLDRLDGELAQRQGQPRDPTSPPPREPSGGGAGLLAMALLVGAPIVLWIVRRKRTKGPADLAAGMARGKLGWGRAAARPSPYRLGMTVTPDPAPFVLAGPAIKAHPPAGATTSVTALGSLGIYDRLYLPEGFYQLHRQGGAIDECRWFSPLDQFTPADEQEWAFWLDPAQGLLGWPTFETKDGKQYSRLWTPGGHRVEPHVLTEQLTNVGGTVSRRHSAMLYAAPTGSTAPAPEMEYVLVAAVEDGAQAWIEVHAGIDVNPLSLSLAP